MKSNSDTELAQMRYLSTLSDPFERILKTADFRENTKPWVLGLGSFVVDFGGSLQRYFMGGSRREIQN